jgi:hypothetical protein
MEKIMSKSNDTSRLAALEDHRPLADSELDAVSGGDFCIPFSMGSTRIPGVICISTAPTEPPRWTTGFF